MKILYFVCLELGNDSGVLKKIKRQVEFWESRGNEVFVFYISSQRNTNHLSENEYVIEPHSILNKFGENYLFKFLFRIYGSIKCLSKLKAIAPDIIYFRQVLWFPFVGRILRIAPSVIEVNNNDVVEMDSKSKLVKKILTIFRYLFFKNVNGVVSVTNELEKSYGKNVEFKALTNSFPVPTKLKDKTIRPNKIIFMSSPNQPWQGVDKILKLAENLSSYEFSIVGWQRTDFKSIPHNVNFRGYLTGNALQEELNSAGYAIGPLALHRKNMNSTSAIKIGEYLSNNLPVILAYQETSVAGPMLCVIENLEANINIENIKKIENFLSYWRKKNIEREAIFRQLSPEVVESQRLRFFKDILCK